MRCMRCGQQMELAAHLLRDEAVQRSNLCEDAHLYTRESADGRMTTEMFTHPGDIVDDSVDDLSLEWFENDRAIPCHELSLSVARNDHARADVRDGDDGNDKAKLARACSLDIRVEFRFEVLLHAGAKVGRV